MAFKNVCRLARLRRTVASFVPAVGFVSSDAKRSKKIQALKFKPYAFALQIFRITNEEDNRLLR